MATAALVVVGLLPVAALGQGGAAPTITSPGVLTVDEGATSVVTLTADDDDTPTGQLAWSKTGGADASHFTVSAAGVLAFGEAKDFEEPDDADADGIYELTVQVSDGANQVTADLSVTVRNVIELETMSGPAAVSFAENGWGRVATFTASSYADRDGITWVLGGDDAAHFSIDNPPGALRFDLAKVAPAVFSKPPDFEAPVDNGTDNTYQITVQSTTTSNSTAAAMSVTVTVTDADESGTVTLSTKRPRKGVAVTATLTDPDGVTAGSASWTWERTDGTNNWVVIPGAGSASYTPTAADAGSFLRVAVTYRDGHGAGAQASTTSPEVVAASQLAGLSISTDDSTAADAPAWRRMRPTFAASTLHYSVGCNSSDTMTLAMSPAGASSRISVDGVRYANPGAGSTLTTTRAVSGDSMVRIDLTDADGARTRYVVHCLADDITEITSTKPRGESQVLDELILYSDRQRLMIVDSNAVPRVVLRPGRAVRPYFRFYPDGGKGEFRYSYTGDVAAVLDENFELVGYGRPVEPLTQRDSHDFRVLENGNFMLMAYQDAERDLSALTFTDGDGQPYGTDVYVEDSAIQIVTPSGRATFTWNSWDHMPPEDCTQHFFPPGDGDYAHLNGNQLAGGIIVASMRGCSRVLGIDARTGDVVWRVGPSNLSHAEWAERDIGPAPLDIIGDPEKQFCGQHAAALVPGGNLILYDNGVQCTRSPWMGEKLLRDGMDYSRGVEYALDLANGEAVFVRDHSLGGSKSELGYLAGNIELLGNGHWLISWGGSRPSSGDVSPSDVITQVDPDTGHEWLSMDSPYDRIRGTVMPAHALVDDRPALEARFVAGSSTSVFHSGTADDPTVLLAFNRPVADFGPTSPSLSVQGATVASVAPHLVAGRPADAYLVTLAPTGSGTITVQVRAGQACTKGGICTADGAVLSKVPGAQVISPPITVSFGAATYRVSESATLAVPVVLSHAHGGAADFELPITATAVSASDDDFSAGVSVSFSAGERSKPVTFEAVGDDLVEGPETVRLGLGTLPAGFSAGTQDTTTVTIADSDSAVIDFRAGSAEVSEGGETELTLAITNGVTFTGDQTINVAVAGSAAGGEDFVLVSGGQTLAAPYAVTLEAGMSSASVTLRATDDADAETTETVSLKATRASTGGLIGSAAVAIGASDLGKPEVTISAGGSVTEGADAVFTLSRTATTEHPLSKPLTVRVQVTSAGGVLAGASPSKVTFGAGESTEEVRLGTVADSVVGDSGGVTVLVRAERGATPAYVVGTANRATVAVGDDDSASFTVSAGAAQLTEGDAVTVTVAAGNVTFAHPQGIDVSVTGTATDGADFVLTEVGGRQLAPPFRLVIGAGAGSASLKVSATLDQEDESGETVVLSFSRDGTSIGSATITLSDVNQPPELSGRDRFQVAENGGVSVGSFAGTDPEGDTISWTLAGDDAALFTITGGRLWWRASPDFEAPTDGGANNVYDITVEASDSGGGGTASRDVEVTVTDVDEPATIASSTGSFVFNYNENDPTGVGTFTASDPERAPIRWSVGGDDRDDFEISSSGVLGFARPPDYEHPADKDNNNRYQVRVLARAGASAPVSVDVTVNVSNVGEPGVVVLSSPQPQAGTALQAAATDPDGTITGPSWAWQRSADGSTWTDIAGASAAAYTPTADDLGRRLRVQVSYTQLGSTHNASTEAPHATRASPVSANATPGFATGPQTRTVGENSLPGAKVGAAVTATDPDSADAGKLVYSLSGADAARFTIDRTTGQIRVGPRTVFDYETGTRTFSVTVGVTDPSGATAAVAVTIALTDANDAPAPADDTASTAEDAPVTIDVLANDTDPDGDTLRVAVRRAPRNGSARVLPDRTIRYSPGPDFNGADIFTYTASDGALSADAVVIVSVSAVNDRPEFRSVRVSRSVADAAQPGSAVGRAVRATDVDGDPLRYRLLDVDAPYFSIDSDTGEITVGGDTVIDRAAQNRYRLRVQASDPSGARVSSFVDVDVTSGGPVAGRPPVGPGPPGPILPRTGAAPRDAFTDDEGSFAEEAINKIAAAGISLGCNAERTRFCPYEPVTRAQMALFLTRALKLPTPSIIDVFEDTGGLSRSFVEAIAAIAEVGITVGCDAEGSRFCPYEPVSRAQMALFLTRALKLQ